MENIFEIMSKIGAEHRKYIIEFKTLSDKAYKNGAYEKSHRFEGIVVGYVRCLSTCGVITTAEANRLVEEMTISEMRESFIAQFAEN